MRLSWICFVISSFAFIFLFAKQYRVQVPAVGGTYTEAIVGSPQRINPIFASVNDVDVDLTRLIFSGLMRYDETQHLVPDIAEAYTVSEDKKVYTFQLRHNVLWHDGQPLTAADVVFTIQTIQDPSVESPLLVTFQGVDVRAIDDYTVEFRLREPFTPFVSSLTVGIIPEHVWTNVTPDQMRLHNYNLQPTGSGPYQFNRLSKNGGYVYRYELKRADNFYRQSPYIQDVVFQFFSSYDGTSGAIEALRENKVDGLSFVPHELTDRVQRKNISLHTLRLPQYTALFFNQHHAPILKETIVRKALEQALDKERILQQAINGEGKVIDGPILSQSPEGGASGTTTPFMVDEANATLDTLWERVPLETYRALRRAALIHEWQVSVQGTASGTVKLVTEDTATTTIPAEVEKNITDQLLAELREPQTFYRKDKNGTIITLTIVTADTPEYRQAAKQIASSWEEIGISTKVQLVNRKDVSRLVLKGRDYDVLLYGAVVGSDPDQYPFWHSSQVDFPGLNLAQYVNKDVDTLLERARTGGTPDEVAEIYKKIQARIFEDRPAIFLYTPTYTYATSNIVFGSTVKQIFTPADRFADVPNWYIKTTGKWK